MTTILFVDAEECVLKPFSMIFVSLGYNVVAMHSSIEARAAFTKEPAGFDIVITDHNMPQLTGYDMAEQCLKIRPDIPIILYTGYSDSISAEKVRKSGIRAFLMKPLSCKELAGIINRVLHSSGFQVA